MALVGTSRWKVELALLLFVEDRMVGYGLLAQQDLSLLHNTVGCHEGSNIAFWFGQLPRSQFSLSVWA